MVYKDSIIEVYYAHTIFLNFPPAQNLPVKGLIIFAQSEVHQWFTQLHTLWLTKAGLKCFCSSIFVEARPS